ncbi:hypothetical protein [Cytobacillus horneckiae]|uniref:hypothetical protein n=1 Tax=Cytobacillus horneckiae TaxID=549687 RepID=UPI003D20D9CA
MSYKKYVTEFQNTEISKAYPNDILNTLFKFIKDEISFGYYFINPYKFAFEAKINVHLSIQLFLFFTKDDSLFTVESFVDCPKCTGKRLSLNPDEIVDTNIIICEDCNSEYLIDDLKNSLYIYFKLNIDYNELDDLVITDNFDTNSTYDVIKRLNGNLKGESPSSSNAENLNNRTIDEGEYPSGVKIEEIIDNNKNDEGEILSDSAQRLSKNLMYLLMTDEAVS